jgi:maleate isomerase
MDYRLTDRIGSRATLGLIVLQTDETLEQDFRRMFTAPDVALYVSRVPSGAEVTPGTLAAMADELPRAAGLLPPSLGYDAVGYGCTSGATVIGPDRVAELVRGAAAVREVTNPLSAVMAGFGALGVRRIGMVTPYIQSVTAPLRAALEARGIEVVRCVSFEEAEEARVARIDPASIREAAIAAGQGNAGAVFVSCTNLRTLDVIEGIEAELGRPVISSNQALGWHMARLAGTACDGRFGRLMRS